MTRQVFIIKEDKYYVATDLLSGVASQGKTFDDALSNLKEALELYFEDDENAAGEDNMRKAYVTTLEVNV